MISWRRLGEVAVVTIDNPPVNAGSHAVRKGLALALDEIALTPNLTGAIITGAGGNFISGSDIREFGAPLVDPQLPAIIEQIETLGIPVIAAIGGNALGGGLELALGCDYRLATSGARLGLPEVGLGIVPGAGGTQRLPRLVGMAAALDLIVNAKIINAEAALAVGLVDGIVSGDLIEECATFLVSMPGKRRLADELVAPCDHKLVAEHVERLLDKAHHRPAALQASKLTIMALEKSFAEALARERAVFQEIRVSSEAFAYRHVFFAERQAAKPVAPPIDLVPLQRVGVIGAGTMGAGIAYAILRAGFEVVIVEGGPDQLTTGLQRIHALVNHDITKGRLTAGAAHELLENLSGATELTAVEPAGLVIEAVFEDVDVKTSLIARLAKELPPSTVIASNTSYLDLDLLFQGLPAPERFLGLHFFSPAHVMKLLEIVVTTQTGSHATAMGFALAKRLEKKPVLARNSHGFIGNRIYAAYRRHAEYLLEDGASPEQVDAAMTSMGMAMGPFAVGDLSGLDIAWRMRRAEAPNRGAQVRYVRIPDLLCEAGRFGRKAGAGYYRYGDGGQVSDPAVAEIIAQERAAQGIVPRSISPEEIRLRCLGAMVNEAALLIDAGVARHAADVDVAMVYGYGFPKWLGGPLWHAAHLSPDTLADALDQIGRAEGVSFRRGNVAGALAALANQNIVPGA